MHGEFPAWYPTAQRVIKTIPLRAAAPLPQPPPMDPVPLPPALSGEVAMGLIDSTPLDSIPPLCPLPAFRFTTGAVTRQASAEKIVRNPAETVLHAAIVERVLPTAVETAVETEAPIDRLRHHLQGASRPDLQTLARELQLGRSGTKTLIASRIAAHFDSRPTELTKLLETRDFKCMAKK